MKIAQRFVKFALLAISLNCIHSFAANVFVDEKQIAIEGKIEKGDAESVAKLMASRAVFLRVILNSPGGDLQEALKITSLVKGARLSTRVVANGVCASACFFILLSDNRRDASGVEEDAQLKRQGSSSLYGLVGLHRPYIAPEVARTDPQSAMKNVGAHLKLTSCAH
jgi:hypothetical protein